MIVGLTGGIASGKSTVSAYFAQKGIPVFDADAVAREITQKDGPGAQAILRVFGKSFFCEDGSLNRRKLAEYVFQSPDRTKRLNEILHPMIQSELLRRANECRAEIKIIDAPLLIESGLYTVCDKIIVVVCETETRVRRAQIRDGLARREILCRISRQIDDTERGKKADFIIDNSGSREQTLRQADEIIKKLGG